MNTWRAIQPVVAPQRDNHLGNIGLFILFCAILASRAPTTAFAQDGNLSIVRPQATNPNQPPLEKFTLTGTVVDSVTGQPVRKALVQLYFNQRRTAFTDDDGRFQMEGIPAGSYSLNVQKPGYFNQQEMQRGGAPSPPVEVGAKASPAVVKLVPESVITGRVVTTAGVPLEHLPVSLTYIEIREGRRRWDFRGSSMTDEDGHYRFANLKPGTYYLSASPYTPLAESMLDANEAPKTGYPGAYYAGAADLASASPIQLAPGQQTEANFSLNEVPVYAVSGTISGYGANQGVGIQVFDVSGTQVDRGVQFSAENGRFDVHALAAGNYLIKAFSSMGPNQPVRAQLPFHLSGDLHNLHLVLSPSPTIPVIVQMESQRSQDRRAQGGGGRPLGPPISVRLSGSGPGITDAYASFENPQNPQTLSLRGVEPGRYTAVIDPRDGWYVASADYGQANLLTDDLVIAAGAPPLALNIMLRNDSASLSGTVNVPDGFTSQVTIVALPEGRGKSSPGVTYWYPPREKTAQPPEFMLDSLAPGEYLVFAFSHADGLEYTSRDALEPYLSQAAHVTLSPGQRAKASLNLIPTSEASN